MTQEMFCFQCEQTAACKGCGGKIGVCGKSSDNAKLQDQLTGALIALACGADPAKATKETHRRIMEGLFTTLTNVNFSEEALRAQIDAV